MSGNPYAPSESFTVRTVAGEEIEIVEKIAGDQRVILVTAEDQRYVSAEQGGLVEPFDPAKHGQGLPATGAAGAKWSPSADATEAAEAREALKNDLPADATEAAEAKAELEADLTQSPERPLPTPVPGGEGGDEGKTTDLAEEQPSGGVVKDGPPAPKEEPTS